MKQRLLTGIKPTGNIHIGNYFGAMLPAVERQEDFETLMFVADLHALNQVQNAAELKRTSFEIAAAYLAVGLDPDKVTLFKQSAVPEVAELSTILLALTSLGALERAHAYKDAKAKGKAINGGLYTYPVLMAADILLYESDLVPVGQDQQQHIEIAIDLAERFNHLFGETLKLPQPLHVREKDLPGIDGRKMSKSYDNVIGLFDSPEVIRKKVARIVTDSKTPEEPKDPDTCSVYGLLSVVLPEVELAGLRMHYLASGAEGISYKEAKELLADRLVQLVEPIQARYQELQSNPEKVEQILSQGAEKARAIAIPFLEKVKDRVGLN